MNNGIKTIVITGASDGIGKEAARILKDKGHNVIIVGRSPEKTKSVAKELGVAYHIADFSRIKDIVRLAKELNEYERIDVLANNAGAVFEKRIVTEDGFEKTFQVNYLSEFLLTNLLLSKLISSKARVIQTSSIASNIFGRGLSISDLQNEDNYSPVKAYGESKLCNILFTKELDEKYGKEGICALAFEPGIPRTNFASEGVKFFKIAYHSPLKYLFTVSKEKSAMRLVRLALDEEGDDLVRGEVYSNKKKFKVKFKDEDDIKGTLWKKTALMLKEYM